MYKSDWELYELLLREVQYMHQRWIDNFRIIITFNSILLPGMFAIFLLIAKTDELSVQAQKITPWILFILSLVGVVVNIVGLALTNRNHIITDLRNKEIGKLEKKFGDELYFHPYREGRLYLEGEVEKVKSMQDEKHCKLWIGKLRGYCGYLILGIFFTIVYLAILLYILFGLKLNC
ncbi:MAG: hypothetical protein JSV84_17505 [Gemmatimonadota bacterium]|nr:MAG: hypothetical protein JSV84_17505 [Gemmatimonadota bacterium]